jgi:hypothetical protein
MKSPFFKAANRYKTLRLFQKHAIPTKSVLASKREIALKRALASRKQPLRI